MVSPQDTMKDHLFMAGIYGDGDGNPTADTFGAWDRSMQRAITPPMETLSSILTWTVFKDGDNQLLANEFLYIAHRVYGASCNRWVEDLNCYNTIVVHIRDGIKDWEDEGEPWDPPSVDGVVDHGLRMAYSLLSPITDDASCEQAREDLTEYRRRARIIQLKIDRAMRTGVMRDFAELRRVLSKSDPARVDNSAVYGALDFFGKRFMDLCHGNMAMTGQEHTEYVLAHAARDARGNAVYGGGQRSRRNSSSASHDDGDEIA